VTKQGKSIFVNRFINGDTNNGNNHCCYVPTESLDIKKSFCKIMDKNIKVELWDTNHIVLNSPIIKTYYKISNGFIVICDYDKIESFNFAERQIDNINNYSNCHNNIFLIVNLKKKNFDPIAIQYAEQRIKHIEDKYSIKAHYMDLTLFNKHDKIFNKFMNSVLFRKVGEDLKHKKKKNNKMSNHSSNDINKHSCHAFDLTKKRNSLLGKNSLNDMFSKLNHKQLIY